MIMTDYPGGHLTLLPAEKYLGCDVGTVKIADDGCQVRVGYPGILS